MPVVDVTDDTFSDLLSRHAHVVVDAWAPWCPPCLKLEPILHELARENEGFVVARLNTDENPQTAARLDILGMPTLVMYRGGTPVGRIVGFQPKPALAQAFARAFS